ncbi:AraC family transcriptional regulator [Pandoraea pneumonica]|uniref:AraC family transcriptional regulator n=1 Tax=Pandoraea pneumonica TaxID=2508299 RepID=UPI003CEAA1A3
MAWLDAHATFDPDAQQRSAIGIASTLGNHDSGAHRHRMGQWLFTQHGCIRITLANQLCLLPPTRAAWIPPGVSHRAVAGTPVEYRSIFLGEPWLGSLPGQIEVIEVGALLREVFERIAFAAWETDWSTGVASHLLALCLAETAAAQRQPLLLPLPSDRRLAPLFDHPEQLPPPLGDLERTVGASARTIGRIFQRETGMSYQQWRQQWRLIRAVEGLSSGKPLAWVADALGFASESAFIAFFKGMTGKTPGQLRQQVARRGPC